MTTRARVAAGLAVLVLAAAVVLVWLVQRDGAGDAPDVTTAESEQAVVASASVKVTASAAARELMTEQMARQYDRTMAGVATTSRRQQTEVAATVAGTALVTATASDARVLVFVNQSTTRDDLEKPLLNLDRVLVTLVRTGGAWRVSELDAL